MFTSGQPFFFFLLTGYLKSRLTARFPCDCHLLGNMSNCSMQISLPSVGLLQKEFIFLITMVSDLEKH